MSVAKQEQPAKIQTFRGTCKASASSIQFEPSELAKALGTAEWDIPVPEITEVRVTVESSSLLPGEVAIEQTGGETRTVAFAPNQATAQQDLIDAVHAAQRGELPEIAERAVPGLNFIALDVETANSDWGSVCQFGASVVRDGDVEETSSWLCQPPAPLEQFEEANVKIHGITADDVQDAMPFDQALAEFVELAGDLPVVAHNAQFDLTALFRGAKAAGAAVPELTFSCSLALARHADLGIKNHRLPTVAKHFDVDLSNHHDAGADAQACAGIVIELAKQAGIQGDLEALTKHYKLDVGNLNEQRVYPVLAHLPSEVAASGAGSSSTGSTAGSAGRGGRSNRGPARWAKAATPDVIPEPNLDADPSGALFGQNVTLSGDFEPFDKGELWEALANKGATVGKNVTKKTTILASGPWESKTSKLKRAEELIEKGQALEIWDKDRLLNELGLDPEKKIEEEQPPF